MRPGCSMAPGCPAGAAASLFQRMTRSAAQPGVDLSPHCHHLSLHARPYTPAAPAGRCACRPLHLPPPAGVCLADVSRPGGAGHALQFRDHGVVLENFKDLGGWLRYS